jgi:hypothetical protein
MAKYQPGKGHIVRNTYQPTVTTGSEAPKWLHQTATEAGIIRLKLVRGAYMEKRSCSWAAPPAKNPINPTLSRLSPTTSGDEACVIVCARHIDRISTPAPAPTMKQLPCSRGKA